jgi:hypothetical protein
MKNMGTVFSNPRENRPAVVEAFVVSESKCDKTALIDQRMSEQMNRVIDRYTGAINATIEHVISNFYCCDQIDGKLWVLSIANVISKTTIDRVDVAQVTQLAETYGCTFGYISDKKSEIPKCSGIRETQIDSQKFGKYSRYVTLIANTDDCDKLKHVSELSKPIADLSRIYVLCFDLAKKHITLYV